LENAKRGNSFFGALSATRKLISGMYINSVFEYQKMLNHFCNSI